MPSPGLEIPLDARVLGFTIGVTLLAALVFWLAPAIAAFASAPASALRQGGGAPTKSRRAFGNGLVVAQVAISLALLSGRVSRMVATSAGWLVGVGCLLGAPAAFWSTRFAARSVENLPAGGALPIASAAAALIAVAFMAVYVPTRRATRVEPVIALRAE